MMVQQGDSGSDPMKDNDHQEGHCVPTFSVFNLFSLLSRVQYRISFSRIPSCYWIKYLPLEECANIEIYLTFFSTFEEMNGHYT